MISSILKIGCKLELRDQQEVEAYRKGGKPPHVLKSRLYDIRPDGSVEIAMPTESGRLILMALGTRYEIVFYTGSGLYRCVGQVTERYKKENLYMVSVELKTNVGKFQRREFYRMECLMDVNYIPVTEEEMALNRAESVFARHMDNSPNDLLRSGTAVDISGGGMRLITPELMAKGTGLVLNFSLDTSSGKKDIWIKGTVLKSSQLEDKSMKCEQRIMFIVKENWIREQIIKYIFEEERKNRKNGKG